MEREVRQLRLLEEDLEIPIQIHLDTLDKRILSIFYRNPTKGWRVNQMEVSINRHQNAASRCNQIGKRYWPRDV